MDKFYEILSVAVGKDAFTNFFDIGTNFNAAQTRASVALIPFSFALLVSLGVLVTILVGPHVMIYDSRPGQMRSLIKAQMQDATQDQIKDGPAGNIIDALNGSTKNILQDPKKQAAVFQKFKVDGTTHPPFSVITNKFNFMYSRSFFERQEYLHDLQLTTHFIGAFFNEATFCMLGTYFYAVMMLPIWGVVAMLLWIMHYREPINGKPNYLIWRQYFMYSVRMIFDSVVAESIAVLLFGPLLRADLPQFISDPTLAVINRSYWSELKRSIIGRWKKIVESSEIEWVALVWTMYLIQLIFISGLRVLQLAIAPLLLPYSLFFTGVYMLIVGIGRLVDRSPFSWHWRGLQAGSREFADEQQLNEEFSESRELFRVLTSLQTSEIGHRQKLAQDAANSYKKNALLQAPSAPNAEDLDDPEPNSGPRESSLILSQIKRAFKPRGRKFEL